jgi:hypothetical protein
MLKVLTRICPALLAPALLTFAVASARAQGSNEVITTPGVGDAARAETTAKAVTKKQRPDAARAQGKRAPLTADQKIGRSLSSAFLRPAPYLMSAFTAGITEWREDKPAGKTTGDELADWGSRAARNFATRSTSTFFSSGVYPALFKQDPRYDPSQSKSVGRRALHAASRVFVTRGDDGSLEPNYSRFAGQFTSSALSNLWERSTPGHDRIGTDATLRRFESSFISGALTNIIFKEFGPDIKRIFHR